MSIYGIKRKDVKSLRVKRAKGTLRQKAKEEDLERKRRLAQREADYYVAVGKRKKAKEGTKKKRQPLTLPTFNLRLKKKKQGKKLTRKKSIGLI